MLVTEASAKTQSRIDETVDQVPGFSDRFTQLLDLANFEQKARYTVGAERFDVAVNTFRKWCIDDRPPRKYGMLHKVVTELLSDAGGDYNPESIVGWLYAGDAVPNPFERKAVDYVLLGELYLLFQQQAQFKSVDFNAIPESSRQTAMDRAMSYLEANAIGQDASLDSYKDDETLLSLIDSLLELASHQLL